MSEAERSRRNRDLNMSWPRTPARWSHLWRWSRPSSPEWIKLGPNSSWPRWGRPSWRGGKRRRVRGHRQDLESSRRVQGQDLGVGNRESLSESRAWRDLRWYLGDVGRRLQQAHLFYNGPPSVSTFDATKDVYKGWLVPFDELEALKNAMLRTSAEEVEDEDH